MTGSGSSCTAARLAQAEVAGEALLEGPKAHGRRGATGRLLLNKLID